MKKLTTILLILKNKVKEIIESHKFFVKESPSFMVGTPKLKYYSKYPFAYFRFMKMQIIAE